MVLGAWCVYNLWNALVFGAFSVCPTCPKDISYVSYLIHPMEG